MLRRVLLALGAVALLGLTLALPARLPDTDAQSVVAPAYEGLRDGSATALRIHETDADGVRAPPSSTPSRWATSSSGTRPTTASCATR